MAESAHRWWSVDDLTDFLTCPHRLTWQRLADAGRVAPPASPDDAPTTPDGAGQTLLLAQLPACGREVAKIPTPLDPLAAAEETRRAMREGFPFIAQGVLLDPPWYGRPGLLVRAEGASELGDWHYEVWEAKAAYHPPMLAWFASALSGLLLRPLQGRTPKSIALVGRGGIERFPLSRAAAYVEWVQRRWLRAVSQPLPPVPPLADPVVACATCRWKVPCDEQRRAHDHLGLVADIRRDQIRKLQQAGIATLSQLAGHDLSTVVPGIGQAAMERLVRQARLQKGAQDGGGHLRVECLTPQPGKGLCRLPAPSQGDVFLEVTAVPDPDGNHLTYLWGLGYWEETGQWRHRLFAAGLAEEEATTFEPVVDWLSDRLASYPDLHVYHYHHPVAATLSALAGQRGARESAVDRLLRGGVLVDLYRIIREGVQVSVESYTLQALAPLYRPGGQERDATEEDSAALYRRWVDSQDSHWRDRLASLSESRCRAIAECRQWLEGLRDQLGITERPQPGSAEPSQAVAAQEAAESLLAQSLSRLDHAGAPLVAHCSQWHRREARAAWQSFFQRRRASAEELWEDAEAVAQLTHVRREVVEERVVVDRYAFPTEQEIKIRVGDRLVDPESGREVGVLAELDLKEGHLAVRRWLSKHLPDPPHPEHLILGGPVKTASLEAAIHRVGWDLVRGGRRYPALYAFLTRTPPRFRANAALPARAGDLVATAAHLARHLDAGYLAVQGPPGTGKTYLGSRVVAELIRAGHTVGITGPSHQVIGNLLKAVKAAWGEESPLPVVRVAREGEGVLVPGEFLVTNAGKAWNAFRGTQARLVAGTAWVFSREEWDQTLDYLVIDEAGQFTLADTIAVASAARNLVLLGDPQQLPHPIQGHHPPEVATSALSHLLGNRDTMPPELGLFLPTTRRCHPAIAHYIGTIAYEGRLTSAPDLVRQAVVGSPPWHGAGLRWVSVNHVGRRTTCPEEVATVTQIVGQLLQHQWQDAQGRRRPLQAEDILVVAPFNAQVHRLQAAVPTGVRVGTVDRFQGQEAPVVIYSLTASDAEHLPHGQTFLFSLNRINVALSRAQGMAILVGNPALLDTLPSELASLEGLNALCAAVLEANS
ncbi:MAG: TM0106 family RecB-like putative nuclease [Firmicutes bacterium]|nr:TM0106 family RecB-like putative nuclease [Bacillota bacterium]